MKLRYYQHEAVDSIWEYFANGGTGNPLVAMPTGTGKSVVIGDFVRRVMQQYPTERILKLTHVKELIAQNFGKLLELWPLAPAGIYSAGLNRRESHLPVTFAGIASVARKAALFGHIDLVLIDEAHTLGPKDDTNYRSFLNELRTKNPALKVIGFTATPFRLGQGHLTDGKGLFTDVCYDITGFDAFNRLIDEGYLCPLVPKRPPEELDVSQVGTVAGEFNQTELQAVVDREEVTRRAVEEMLRQGEERAHWLVFAAGVEHSNHIAEMLCSYDVPAVSIHSKLSDDARDAAIRDWKAGRYRCAVNNNVLTTGFDFPALDLIAWLRPTKSPVLWIQGLGRGTRPHPSKQDCLVLDFAGNTARLGPINDPVMPKPRGAKVSRGAPVKLCPHCHTWNHSSTRYCTNCGEEFVAQVKIKERASELELIARRKVVTNDDPVVLDFDVLHVEYDVHQPRFARKAPSLRITYTCDGTLLRYKEWLPFESESNLARHKARDWWRSRTGEDPPETTDEAHARTAELPTPRRIRVWVNAKYPQIMAHDYTGDGFDA